MTWHTVILHLPSYDEPVQHLRLLTKGPSEAAADALKLFDDSAARVVLVFEGDIEPVEFGRADTLGIKTHTGHGGVTA